MINWKNKYFNVLHGITGREDHPRTNDKKPTNGNGGGGIKTNNQGNVELFYVILLCMLKHRPKYIKDIFPI